MGNEYFWAMNPDGVSLSPQQLSHKLSLREELANTNPLWFLGDDCRDETTLRLQGELLANYGGASLTLWEPVYLHQACKRFVGDTDPLQPHDLPTRPTHHIATNLSVVIQPDGMKCPLGGGAFLFRSILLLPQSASETVMLLVGTLGGEKRIARKICRVGDTHFFAMLLKSLTRFMRDELQVERVEVPKKIARGLKNRVPPEVRRLTLRPIARKSETGNPRAVDWSCRWTVRGHWRKQYYPSLGEHKMVFVSAHRKGPKDKPLRTTRIIPVVSR